MGLTAAATRTAQRSTVAAPAPPARRRPGGQAAPTTLGARLRAETMSEHAEAERAFDLPRRLGSRDEYGDALVILDAFARAGEPRLEALAGALPPPLRDGPARRRARLAADLAALGRPGAGAGAGAGGLGRLGRRPAPVAAGHGVELDHALGLLYVHEGAALGGLRIAAEVRHALPAVAAAGAVAFFSGEGRGTAARWRVVQVTLAAWAPAESDCADRVVAGARQAFAAFAETLAGATG